MLAFPPPLPAGSVLESIPGAELRVIPGLGHDRPLQLVPVFAGAISAAAARAVA